MDAFVESQAVASASAYADLRKMHRMHNALSMMHTVMTIFCSTFGGVLFIFVFGCLAIWRACSIRGLEDENLCTCYNSGGYHMIGVCLCVGVFSFMVATLLGWMYVLYYWFYMEGFSTEVIIDTLVDVPKYGEYYATKIGNGTSKEKYDEWVSQERAGCISRLGEYWKPISNPYIPPAVMTTQEETTPTSFDDGKRYAKYVVYPKDDTTVIIYFMCSYLCSVVLLLSFYPFAAAFIYLTGPMAVCCIYNYFSLTLKEFKRCNSNLFGRDSSRQTEA